MRYVTVGNIQRFNDEKKKKKQNNTNWIREQSKKNKNNISAFLLMINIDTHTHNTHWTIAAIFRSFFSTFFFVS